MMRRAHVSHPRLIIISREIAMPMMGVNGIQGATKARGTSVPRLRRIQTPPQTMMKAMSVPMETSSLMTLIGVSAATDATQMPMRIVEM